ncbi:MAG TPA: hypothetical protein VFT99_02155 [Roseiflexaceae bacterium]|nr:hypothetical protein [Roseiflexaceae bacterium]
MVPFSRIRRLLSLAVVVSAFALGLQAPAPALAASSMPQLVHAVDPFEAIMKKVENVATGISKLSTPVAILGIILVLLMILFAPLLPEVAQQNKGYIIRALIITAVIGIIPEFVKAFASLGS